MLKRRARREYSVVTMRAIVLVLALAACVCVQAGTAAPSSAPTIAPTTAEPTNTPTAAPSIAPTTAAPTTAAPTSTPTSAPSAAPTTAAPTSAPTIAPTAPSAAPTSAPSAAPTTAAPTSAPTSAPTIAPTASRAGSVNTTYTVTATGNASTAVLSVNASTPPYGLTFTTPNASAATLSVTALDAANAATIAAQGCGAPDSSYVVTAAFRATRTNSFDALVNVSAYGQVYTTVDRLIWACSYNGTATWTTPAALCANVSSNTTGSAVDGTSVVEPICRSGVYLMLEPIDADRTCVDGLYGCSCDRTSKTTDSDSDVNRWMSAGFSLIAIGFGVFTIFEALERHGDKCFYTCAAYCTREPEEVAGPRLSRIMLYIGQGLMTTGGAFVSLAWINFLPARERGPDPWMIDRCASNFVDRAWTYTGLLIAFQLASGMLQISVVVGLWGDSHARLFGPGDDGKEEKAESYRLTLIVRTMVLAAASVLTLPMATTMNHLYRMATTAVFGAGALFAAILLVWSFAWRSRRGNLMLAANVFIYLGEIGGTLLLLAYSMDWPCGKTYLRNAHC